MFMHAYSVKKNTMMSDKKTLLLMSLPPHFFCLEHFLAVGWLAESNNNNNPVNVSKKW